MGGDGPTCICSTSVLGAQNVPDSQVQSRRKLTTSLSLIRVSAPPPPPPPPLPVCSHDTAGQTGRHWHLLSACVLLKHWVGLQEEGLQRVVTEKQRPALELGLSSLLLK